MNGYLEEFYMLEKKDRDKALESLDISKIIDTPTVMYPNIDWEIKERLPNLSDEEIGIVIELIEEYR